MVAIALFLNPFGYDIIVYGITQLTNSYWVTMGIMYLMAMIFFSLFVYFNDLKFMKLIRVNTKLIIRNNKINLKNK